jgi:hypothetical protein
MKLNDSLSELGARLRVRDGLAERHADTRRVEAESMADVHATARELDEARAAYAKAPSEPGRLKVRELAGRLGDKSNTHDAARAAEREAHSNLRRAADSIAGTCSQLFDPELVAKSSAKAAMATLDPETARRWAAGEVEIAETKAFVANVAAHALAVEALRAQGCSWGRVAPTFFLLPLFEALAERGLAPLGGGQLFMGDYVPPVDQPAALKGWCERASDTRPNAPAAAGLMARLQRIRALVDEFDVRDNGSLEQLEHRLARPLPPHLQPATDVERERLEKMGSPTSVAMVSPPGARLIQQR